MHRTNDRRRRSLRAPLGIITATVAALVVAVAAADSGASARRAEATFSDTSTLTFTAAADARVEEAFPTTNYGAKWLLGTDGDAGSRIESDLRFDVTGLAGTVQNATLRLHVSTDPTVDGPAVYPTGDNWTESGVTWATRPQPTGAAVADIGAVGASTWVELDVTALVAGNGSVDLVLAQTGTDGVTFDSRESANKPELVVTTANTAAPPPPPADPVVMAAGDIACAPGATVGPSGCRQQATSDLLTATPGPTKVLALGDDQYEDGAYAEYTGPGAYDATWGRVKAITAPVPGNHEYGTAGAAGYFAYFGSAAGPPGEGYYSFDLGSWHLIALNSEISAAAGSAQDQWLRNDLASTKQPCILAYWHRPRFSSGEHGGTKDVAQLWSDLYAAHADIVLNGHDHDYERFARQNPSGAPDPNGIREFVVGTGGDSHYALVATQPNSEIFDGDTFGVLEVTLHASGYDWRFVPAGGTFTDSGSDECHERPPVASVTTAPSAGAAPLTVSADASASSDEDATPDATYSFDFGDGSAPVGPQADPAASHVYAAPGTYTVAVTVTDTGGLSSTASSRVAVRPNLIGNPSFEADISGWNTGGSGTGVTLSRVAGGQSGGWSAQLANTSAAPTTCLLNDSPNSVAVTSAGTYVAKLWVRADTAGATLKLRLREYSGSTLMGSASTQATLTTSWQQVSVAYTPLAAGASTLDYNAYVANAAPGTCFYADSASLAAYARPSASLSALPPAGSAPLAVTADASASTAPDGTPIASYTFDFGDGSPQVGPQTSSSAAHTYSAAGSYTITVKITNVAGYSSTATAQVSVADSPPRAALAVDPTSGAAPAAVSADASASSDDDATPIESYTFDFGDGSPPVGPQPAASATHVYAAPGRYTVEVTVTDTAGFSSTGSSTVVVEPNLVRNPSFETDTSGWNVGGSGGGVTLGRVPGGQAGDWAAQLTSTSATATECVLNDSPNSVAVTSAGTYTAALWVRADNPGATVKLRLREYGGSTLLGSASAQTALSTSWQRVSVAYTPTAPGASTLDLNAYLPSANAGTCFYADSASLYVLP